MSVIELKAHVGKGGIVTLHLPPEFENDEVSITIASLKHDEPPAAPDLSWEDRPWTEDEISEFLQFRPTSGTDIVAEGLVGGWEDMGITDSAAWVEELRRKEQERYKWS